MSRGLILLAAFVVALGVPRQTVAQAPTLQADDIPVASVLANLGSKPAAVNCPTEIELGRSITASLVSPDKIAEYGIKGMHEGARVTVTRIAPDRLRVEADELEPVAAKSVVVVRVAGDGSLTVVPERTPSKAPPLDF